MMLATTHQQRHDDHRGQQARGDQVAGVGVGGEGVQRIDLLGGAAGADLALAMAAETRPASIRAASTGPKLAGDPQGHDLGHDLLGVEAPAAGVDVERQGRAGGTRWRSGLHHRQGEEADARRAGGRGWPKNHGGEQHGPGRPATANRATRPAVRSGVLDHATSVQADQLQGEGGPQSQARSGPRAGLGRVWRGGGRRRLESRLERRLERQEEAPTAAGTGR